LRFYVVFNPQASRGGARRARKPIEEAFRREGVTYQIVATERRGHAVELAHAAAAAGWSVVVAVGGDGIVHEVVNGLMRAGDAGLTVPQLGIIPIGSGNDFIKMLGIPPHNPAEAVRRIVHGQSRVADVGRVSRHVSGDGPPGVWYFANGVGVGFDAQVARHARGIQRLRGLAIYAWALVKTLRDLRAPRIQVIVDGATVADHPLILTTVSNGPCHGGSFWLCPGARVDDGLLDILVADARSLPAVIRLVPLVMFGKHLGQAGVRLMRGRHVEVRSEEALPIHADGEIVAEWVREMVIEVNPGRLTVRA
jgi:diacylglycerol kinase (ATP)